MVVKELMLSSLTVSVPSQLSAEKKKFVRKFYSLVFMLEKNFKYFFFYMLERKVSTLSPPVLFSAKCKSLFRKFIASFVFYAGKIYQETFFLEKTLNFFFIYK